MSLEAPTKPEARRVWARPATSPLALAPPVRRGLATARYGRISIAIAASDALCLTVSFLASYLLRFGFRGLPGGWLATALIAPLLWVAVFKSFRLYDIRNLSSWDEFTRTVSAVGVGIILVTTLSFWSNNSFSRGWLGITFLVALILELLFRRAWHVYCARLRANGELSLRTLIVGTNEEAEKLSKVLRAHEFGLDPLGYVSIQHKPISANGLHVLGKIDELEEAIRTHDVDCLFVASTAVDPEHMMRVAQAARLEGVEVKVSANLPEMLTSRITVQPIGPLMSLSLKPVTLTGGQALAKRIFDVSVASAVLMLTLPLWPVIILAIKLSSPGPAIFRQRRVTRGGRAFQIFKFRTMVQDGDHLLKVEDLDTATLFFKLRDDPRMTTVGRFLRRLSLDELPQLLNVIRGEMSMVGPRPLPSDQLDEDHELLRARHDVPAGLTGWWQIRGRSDLTPEQSLRMDLFYIENWSLSLDLYILLKTFGALIARAGAY